MEFPTVPVDTLHWVNAYATHVPCSDLHFVLQKGTVQPFWWLTVTIPSISSGGRNIRIPFANPIQLNRLTVGHIKGLWKIFQNKKQVTVKLPLKETRFECAFYNSSFILLHVPHDA